MLKSTIFQVFEDETVRNYVQGIAVHWYNDQLVSPSRLDETHQNHEDKFILGTEACTGTLIILQNLHQSKKY